MKGACTEKKLIRDVDGNSEMLPLQPEPSISWRHGGGAPSSSCACEGKSIVRISTNRKTVGQKTPTSSPMSCHACHVLDITGSQLERESSETAHRV